MKAEITRIKLKLGDREIELSAEEARELHAELSKMFSEPQVKVVKEYLPAPYIPPVIIDRTQEWPKWGYPDITCGTMWRSLPKTTSIE